MPNEHHPSFQTFFLLQCQSREIKDYLQYSARIKMLMLDTDESFKETKHAFNNIISQKQLTYIQLLRIL